MKIYFESYGCTLNKSEAGLYANSLLKEGNSLVSRPDEADVSVIGTCVVIKQTEDRMIRRIEKLSQSSKVRVIGCLSSVTGGALSSNDIEVLSPKDFRSFYSGQLDDIEIREPSVFDGIPINQGCTGSCNYCISHIARGKLLSRPEQKVVGQVRMQLEKGIKEVRISSLDTAAYGKDIGTSLDSLIGSITGIEGDFKLRVGMMEPKNTHEIMNRIFDAYNNDKVFKFLHLPVQSGDDRILDLMNREYSVEQYYEIVNEYRGRFPDSLLSTDIIAGYHDEDQDSFEKTCRMIEKSKPEIINVTRFSPRPYTPDFDRKTPPSNMIKEWTKAYQDLHKSILAEKYGAEIGRIREIMINEKGKKGTSVGRDHAYRPVVVPGEFSKYARVTCEIIDMGDTYLIGKVL